VTCHLSVLTILMRSIIVGTAGHIDHGKTALVRALTGVDADRLPEEKRRGITIDLGFAELDLDDVRVGFVDVPGHERFIKNMLAGAHGIDVVALVVAADEGVMPQTREHFDITRLLGVRAGLVVLTKIDLVDEELLELVRAEVAELVADSFLAGAPVVAVSTRTGAGLDELRAQLRETGLHVPARSNELVARLPIDRAFTMRGFGAVVTGTLVAGEIVSGEELELLPACVRVRVRGLQVHGRAVERARAAQRTAINLGGVEASAIERGMVLAAAARVLDASATKHRGREREQARARLQLLTKAEPAHRLALFVAAAGEQGLRRADLAARTGWRDEVLDRVVAEMKKTGAVHEAEGVLIAAEVFTHLMRAALDEVQAHHRREPLQRGLARETLRERVFAHVPPEIFRAVLAQAESAGALVAERDVVRAATHSLALSTADAALRD